MHEMELFIVILMIMIRATDYHFSYFKVDANYRAKKSINGSTVLC